MTPARVEVSRPDKLLWPAIAITKQAYVDYLSAVSQLMLPWLRDRPLSLIRAPDGVDGQRYFQKNTPSHAPTWIKTVTIPAPSAGRDVAYTVCNDADTLAWLGNQAALEFHPRRCAGTSSTAPTCSSPTSTRPTTRSTPRSRSRSWCSRSWTTSGSRPCIKTTGGKGLHIVVPIVRHVSAERLRHAATRLAEIATERRPDLVTAEFRKAKRGGRVMLDPSRNGPGATLVAAYSPRIRPDGTVSFPVLPKDLRKITPGDFTLETARSS